MDQITGMFKGTSYLRGPGPSLMFEKKKISKGSYLGAFGSRLKMHERKSSMLLKDLSGFIPIS